MARAKGDTGKAPILSHQEVKRLLKVTSAGKYSERNLTILMLSYWLGLRAKEIASLHICDVFEANGQIKTILHLKPAYTKKAKARDVYLSSDDLRKRLKMYWRWLEKKRLNIPEQQLFTTFSRRVFTRNGMVQLIGHLHKEAGIARGSSHSGRRTMITRLAEAGIDLKAISKLAGHASISTTAGYIEDNPVRLAKIMEGLEVK